MRFHSYYHVLRELYGETDVNAVARLYALFPNEVAWIRDYECARLKRVNAPSVFFELLDDSPGKQWKADGGLLVDYRPLVSLYRRGYTQKQVGDWAGLSQVRISQILSERDVPVHKQNTHPPLTDLSHKIVAGYLRRLYASIREYTKETSRPRRNYVEVYQEGNSIRDVANWLDVSPSTVWRHLNREGVHRPKKVVDPARVIRAADGRSEGEVAGMFGITQQRVSQILHSRGIRRDRKELRYYP